MILFSGAEFDEAGLTSPEPTRPIGSGPGRWASSSKPMPEEAGHRRSPSPGRPLWGELPIDEYLGRGEGPPPSAGGAPSQRGEGAGAWKRRGLDTGYNAQTRATSSSCKRKARRGEARAPRGCPWRAATAARSASPAASAARRALSRAVAESSASSGIGDRQAPSRARAVGGVL